jgi:hypothetical protein
MARRYFPAAMARRNARRGSTGGKRTIPVAAVVVGAFAVAGGGTAATKPSTVPAVIHVVTGSHPKPARPAAPRRAAPGAMPGAQWLTIGQVAFGRQLTALSGLNPAVISAWMLAEQSGSAARYYQDRNFNDWLNIGRTGSGDFGTGDSLWADPARAARATWEWMTGHASVPGYGPGAPSVQAIARIAGHTAPVQIAAIQESGWAGSGYPGLPALYAQVADQ